MYKLLLLANRFKDPPNEIIQRLLKLYDSIVTEGLRFHQVFDPLAKGSRRKQKKRIGHNLVERLIRKQGINIMTPLSQAITQPLQWPLYNSLK